MGKPSFYLFFFVKQPYQHREGCTLNTLSALLNETCKPVRACFSSLPLGDAGGSVPEKWVSRCLQPGSNVLEQVRLLHTRLCQQGVNCGPFVSLDNEQVFTSAVPLTEPTLCRFVFLAIRYGLYDDTGDVVNDSGRESMVLVFTNFSYWYIYHMVSREQLETKLIVKSSVVPQRLSRLRDRWWWWFFVFDFFKAEVVTADDDSTWDDKDGSKNERERRRKEK